MNTPEKEVTIYDIAKKLSISPATVSRALVDHPAVNYKTKEKILEAAKSMGYRSNHLASNLRTKKTNTIGVVVPRLNSNFTSDVLAGIEKVLNEAGYNLIISQSFETLQKETTNFRSMYNNRVDGLLVSLAYESNHIEHFEAFINRHIPVVCFDRVVAHDRIPGIVIDNFKAGYEITSHLIKQGCKRIAHITAPHMHSVYNQRLEGYKKALIDNNIPFNYQLILGSDLTFKGSANIADVIMKMPERPDGIFAAADACAVNCIQGLKKHGIRVPEDMAIAGFNNDPLACVVEPNLTTVDYHGYNMGEVSARILLKCLNNNYNALTDKEVILPADLIIRASTLRNKTQ